jgi:hypothetical protein
MATAPIPMQPMTYQPNGQPQPVMIQGAQPVHASTMQGIPIQGMPIPVAPVHGLPGQQVIGQPAQAMPSAVMNCAPPMGVGMTRAEMDADILAAERETNLLEPQDIKPADDDPARMYLVRELDGNWTTRNRFTIDRMPMRWFLTPWGGFYAARLDE